MKDNQAEAIAAARKRAGLASVPRPFSARATGNARGHWRRNPTVRLVLFVLGCLLLASAAVVGPIPGPGGVVVAAAGLSLMLQNSRWAKRQYVRLERRYPRAGSWSDWALRRPSPRRREALRKLQDALPVAECD